MKYLGKIIVQINDQQQAIEWVKRLPLKQQNEKVVISLCQMYKQNLLQIQAKDINSIIRMIVKNLIDCTHTQEQIRLLKEFLQYLLTSFNQLFEQAVNELDVQEKEAIFECLQ